MKAEEMIRIFVVLVLLATSSMAPAAPEVDFRALPGPPPQWQPSTHSLCYSKGGTSVAYLVADGWKQWVVHDGEKGPEFGQIQDLAFVGDSDHIVYRAERDGKWHFVHDGREGPGLVSQGRFRFKQVEPATSADGSRQVYAARDENQWFQVADGEIIERFQAGETVNNGHYGFSPSGRHFFCCTYSNSKNPGTVFHLDGQRTELVKNALRSLGARSHGCMISRWCTFRDDEEEFYILVSHDNRWWLVSARTDNPNQPLQVLDLCYKHSTDSSMAFCGTTSDLVLAAEGTVRRNGKKIYEYDSRAGTRKLKTSEDGTRIAHLIGSSSHWCDVLEDGVSMGPFSNVRKDGFFYLPTGELVIRGVKNGPGGEQLGFVMIAGRLLPPTDRKHLATVLPSDDGEHWLCYGWRQGELWVFVDGERVGDLPEGRIRSLGFLPGSSKLYYVVATKTGEKVLADGASRGEWPGITNLFLGPGPEDMVFWQKRGGLKLVVNGKPVERDFDLRLHLARRPPFGIEKGLPGFVLHEDGTVRSTLCVEGVGRKVERAGQLVIRFDP